MDNPALTHARVLKIALPILLANVAIPLQGMVDTAVVGQIPEAEPIAAVGVGATILTAIYWVFGFLRMGTTGLTAQAIGQGDQAEVAALFSRGLMLGLAGGLCFVLIQPMLFVLALALSPASPEVEGLALGYMQIRIWSAPAIIALYGVTGWLIAQERTRDVLLIQLVMTAANITLNLGFVLGLNWGVSGVAWATFLAEWAGLAMGLWLCRAALADPAWRDWPKVFDAARLRRMASVNTDILIRSALLQAMLVSFLLLGGRFGDVTLAANQVLVQFLHITGYALDGFAFAAEALVGQAFGAQQRARLRRAVWLSSLWAGLFACALIVTFWAVGPWMITVISKDNAVQAVALTYLPWMVLAPLAMLGMVMLDGIFIGATRTRDMRNMMAMALLCYLVALWLLLEPMQNAGLWLSYYVAMVARAVTLALRYPSLERAASPR